jgi:hypothetical protein
MMKCVADKTGKKCVNCGWRWNHDTRFPRRVCTGIAQPQLQQGPGDHLHSLVRRYFGEQATLGCGCAEWINKLNAWGAAGCREHIDEIAERLLNQADEKGWWTLTGKLMRRVLSRKEPIDQSGVVKYNANGLDVGAPKPF